MYRLTSDGSIDAPQGQASGEAAIAAILKNTKGRFVDDYAERIGYVKDHHVAEYKALIEGLKMARRHDVSELRAFVDSALVANQISREWKCEAEHLQPLLAEADALIEEFKSIKICWVPREMNAGADVLASQTLRPDPE